MLHVTAERAGLEDGQRVLDLGCGWGSFALWAAERYPQSTIIAVSHSSTQHEYVSAEACRRGLSNVWHILADVNAADFVDVITAGLKKSGDKMESKGRFDRIVSIEMFEHLRNIELLLNRVGHMIAPDGRMLVHMFCHRDLFYRYEDRSQGDWMARHFFTGGAMPPKDLFEFIRGPLNLLQCWEVGGDHYQRTCQAWLANLDQRRADALASLARHLPQRAARVQLQRWRMFLMACEELFAHAGGRQWFVSHHLLAPA
jgi:cyclopropane-fatty-acyl-phospholipid synthase